tara:strand:- start:196 stop:933 length:738 start_codon:yes stop_codon:yes gene_type:complete
MAQAESIYGNEVEKEIIKFLDNKRLIDLKNCKLKQLIFHVFGLDINENLTISCKKYKKKSNSYKGNPKPDLQITLNKIKKNISIKSGKGCSLHEEPLITFLNFLENFPNSNKYLNIVETHLKKAINIRNTEVPFFFKMNKANIIKRVLDGIYPGEEPVDFYYAILSIKDKKTEALSDIIRNGFFASKKEIENFMNNNEPGGKGQSGTCDVGILRYQSYNRNKYPKPQFKWPNPYEDIKKIRSKND